MDFKLYFSKQARKPTGLFGRWYAPRVFDKKNLPLNNFMYTVLATKENDRLLELGFGTGSLIRRIADSVDGVRAEGVDFSRQMYALARKRNRAHLRKGKVNLQMGDFAEVPYGADCFDAVYSVNTVYFWQDPEKMVRKIYHILKPGGRMLVGYYDRADMEHTGMSKEIFQLYSEQEMRALLTSSFAPDAVSQVTHHGEGKPCQCAIGTK